jgi:hypothetical protein
MKRTPSKSTNAWSTLDGLRASQGRGAGLEARRSLGELLGKKICERVSVSFSREVQVGPPSPRMMTE